MQIYLCNEVTYLQIFPVKLVLAIFWFLRKSMRSIFITKQGSSGRSAGARLLFFPAQGHSHWKEIFTTLYGYRQHEGPFYQYDPLYFLFSASNFNIGMILVILSSSLHFFFFFDFPKMLHSMKMLSTLSSYLTNVGV